MKAWWWCYCYYLLLLHLVHSSCSLALVQSQWTSFFRNIAKELKEEGGWQKVPRTYSKENSSQLLISSFFTTEDVNQSLVEGTLREAGRGVYSEEAGRGWGMARVSKTGVQPTKEDIATALTERAGTVIFNSAGASQPALANVCLGALEGFGLPTCLNLYLTAAGQATSAPPHTDKQDVLVVQTQGRKRWRVFSPPAPQKVLHVSPFERGKGADVLSLKELDAPLLDLVLEPGMTLYCPAGFPHTTSTVDANGDVLSGDPDASIHMTIGVDTYAWALDFATLRRLAFRIARERDSLLGQKIEATASYEAYWDLHAALPLGSFLAAGLSNVEAAEIITAEALKRITAAEPERWGNGVPPTVEAAVGEVACRLVAHHTEVCDIFRQAYSCPSQAQILNGVPQVTWVAELERKMEALFEWARNGGGKDILPPMGTTNNKEVLPGVVAPAKKGFSSAPATRGAGRAKKRTGFGLYYTLL